jgi:hypothetical protein
MLPRAATTVSILARLIVGLTSFLRGWRLRRARRRALFTILDMDSMGLGELGIDAADVAAAMAAKGERAPSPAPLADITTALRTDR